jgi:hypothetical protein
VEDSFCEFLDLPSDFVVELLLVAALFADFFEFLESSLFLSGRFEPFENAKM